MYKNTKDWEKDIFSKGKQLNEWPNSDLVSEVKRIFPGSSLIGKTVLEIGFGTGNNLLFFGSEGCIIRGLEYSQTAINFAFTNLNKNGIKADLLQGSVTDGLPWENDSVDIVIDRGCLTQVCFDDVSAVVEEIYRVLKKDGHFFTFTLLGNDSNDLKYGVEVGENTYDHFSEGFFSKNGLTSVYDVNIIKKIFARFELIKMNKIIKTDVLTGVNLTSYNAVLTKD